MESNTHIFDPTDGPTCRENFKDTEDFHSRNIKSYEADAEKLSELYEDILDRVHEGCELVGNQKFLKFITDNRSGELSDEVRRLFLTEEGAEPFTNTDELALALSVMFD